MSRFIRAAWVSAILGCVTAEAAAVRAECFGCGSSHADGSVDLFAAIENGTLQARVIVRDPYHGRIVLQNVSALPLALNIPQFLGAQPVLAQQGFFPGQQQQGNTPGAGNQAGLPQSVGGTPRSSRSNGIFSGNGPFNIAPEQVRTIEFDCFCLEQGKPNPRAAVTYRLAPLAEVNSDPRLPELLAAHARGDADREIVQAAVWHAANEMSWDDLAALSQKIAINAERAVFSIPQLRQANALVESAEKTLATAQAAAKKEIAAAAKIRL